MAATPNVTVNVTADASQALAELKKATEAAVQLRAAAQPYIKPGYRTSEFAGAVVVPALLTLATLIWHKDFSGYVQAAMAGVMAFTSAAYALGRAHLKKPVDLSSLVWDLKQLIPIGTEVVQDVQQELPLSP